MTSIQNVIRSVAAGSPDKRSFSQKLIPKIKSQITALIYEKINFEKKQALPIFSKENVTVIDLHVSCHKFPLLVQVSDLK